MNSSVISSVSQSVFLCSPTYLVQFVLTAGLLGRVTSLPSSLVSWEESVELSVLAAELPDLHKTELVHCQKKNKFQVRRYFGQMRTSQYTIYPLLLWRQYFLTVGHFFY